MNLYHPALPPKNLDSFAMTSVAMKTGRQMALSHHQSHPDTKPSYYAEVAASYVHSVLMPTAAKHLRQTISPRLNDDGTADSPSQFLDHAQDLEAIKVRTGVDGATWYCWIIDFALGVSQVADQLDQKPCLGRDGAGMHTLDLLSKYFWLGPEHRVLDVKTTGQLARRTPKTDTAPHRQSQTVDALIDNWVDGVSKSERSRRRSSAKLFLTAAAIRTDEPAATLAQVGAATARKYIQLSDAVGSKWGTVAHGFAKHTADEIIAVATQESAPPWAQYPLKPRGRQSRISHVIEFLAFARDAGIGVPEIQWSTVADEI